MNSTPPSRDPAAHSSDWVNITLSGQAPAVEAMIHLLHRLNVIAASEWSQIVPLRDSPIVMRVASRGMRRSSTDQRSPAPPDGQRSP
jgi:hypothetical protein